MKQQYLSCPLMPVLIGGIVSEFLFDLSNCLSIFQYNLGFDLSDSVITFSKLLKYFSFAFFHVIYFIS